MRSITFRAVPALLLAGILPLAGCGSSSSSSSASIASSKYSQGLKFASCMRSHGVSNFPDPKTNSAGMQIQSSPNGTYVNGVSVNGPAFRTAMQACQSEMPHGNQSPAQQQSRRAAALRFSACMRSHGISNFPDPIFHGNQIQMMFKAGTGIDPNSPAFKSAQQACGSLIGKAP